MDTHSDKFIVQQIRNGKTEYISELYEKYKFFARKLTHSYLLIHKYNGVTFDDIFSRALESIDLACKHFDEKVSVSFYNYWRKIATHEIEDMLLEETYSGRARAFAGISLDALIRNGEMTYSEIYGVREPFETDEEVKQRYKSLIQDPLSGFTKSEQFILLGLIDGKNPRELKQKLKITPSTYSYHYCRATDKLKKILND